LTQQEIIALCDLEKDFPKVINLVDKLDLEELILMIDRCSVFIAQDSGPLHIAMAVKTPAVALFATNEWRKIFSGIRRGDTHVVISCNPIYSPYKLGGVQNRYLKKDQSQPLDSIPISKIVVEVEAFLTKRN
ncbi:MAG TPA: hypothetical protein ENO27_01240, partial [Caldithrix sp.]|nr:hypothetical protein [Caldithrix sp.]